eukprot:1642505-Karenia_brevis.AAC.1
MDGQLLGNGSKEIHPLGNENAVAGDSFSGSNNINILPNLFSHHHRLARAVDNNFASPEGPSAFLLGVGPEGFSCDGLDGL